MLSSCFKLGKRMRFCPRAHKRCQPFCVCITSGHILTAYNRSWAFVCDNENLIYKCFAFDIKNCRNKKHDRLHSHLA